jgi:hypothetical protein
VILVQQTTFDIKFRSIDEDSAVPAKHL